MVIPLMSTTYGHHLGKKHERARWEDLRCNESINEKSQLEEKGNELQLYSCVELDWENLKCQAKEYCLLCMSH